MKMKKNKLQKILEGISYSQSGEKKVFMDRFHYIMPVKEMKRISDILDGTNTKTKIQSTLDLIDNLKQELKNNTDIEKFLNKTIAKTSFFMPASGDNHVSSPVAHPGQTRTGRFLSGCRHIFS